MPAEGAGEGGSDEVLPLPAKYVEIRLIGNGSHGTAHLVRCREDGQLYVNKRIDIKALPKRERLAAASECAILSSMRHPNVLEAKESFFDAWGCLNFVTQYCEGGDLHRKVQEAGARGQHFGEAEVMDYFVQIAGAVRYIHGRRTLHRDLKTQNIFLRRDGTLRLGDFGIAKVLERTQDFAHTVAGTPYYMSPEVCENKAYTAKSDIWALGCMLYELCTLRHAFDAPNILGLVFQIVKGEYAPIPAPRYSEGLRRLVDSMLSRDPEDRPSAEGIIQSRFVQEHLARFCRERGLPWQDIVPDLRDVRVTEVREAPPPEGREMTARERLVARKLAAAVERERQLAEAARQSVASREEARQRYSHEFHADYLSPRGPPPEVSPKVSLPETGAGDPEQAPTPAAAAAAPAPAPPLPSPKRQKYAIACEWLGVGHDEASRYRPLEHDPLRNVAFNWEFLESMSPSAEPSSFFTQSYHGLEHPDPSGSPPGRGEVDGDGRHAMSLWTDSDGGGDSQRGGSGAAGAGAHTDGRAPDGWPADAPNAEGLGRVAPSPEEDPQMAGLGLGRVLDSLNETVRSDSPDPATLPTLASMVFGSDGSPATGSPQQEGADSLWLSHARPGPEDTEVEEAMQRILKLKELKDKGRVREGGAGQLQGGGGGDGVGRLEESPRGAPASVQRPAVV